MIYLEYSKDYRDFEELMPLVKNYLELIDSGIYINHYLKYPDDLPKRGGFTWGQMQCMAEAIFAYHDLHSLIHQPESSVDTWFACIQLNQIDYILFDREFSSGYLGYDLTKRFCYRTWKSYIPQKFGFSVWNDFLFWFKSHYDPTTGTIDDQCCLLENRMDELL